MKNKTNSEKKENKKTKKSEGKEKRQKETKLEEELEKAEKEIEHREETEEQDFFEEPIRQIPISAEISAPVLERIIQREVPINNIVETQSETKEREERRIEYSPETNQPNYGFAGNREENEDKKYESTFVPPVLSRREIFRNEMKQEFLRSPEEAWQNRTSGQQLGEVEVLEQETRLPFEEQKKYKRHKLR